MFSVMGNCISCWKRHREPHKEITLLLVGIDNAGKTVAAKGLLGESIEGVAPTVGFSSSSMRYDKFDVTLHDLGGGKKIRAIWKNYLSEAYGLIYVVDSSDGERMQESKAVLKDLLQNPRISGKPVLVLANKQDVPGALDEIDVVDQLDLELLVNTYKCPCRVETCSASLGQGKKMDAALRAGFRWLLETISANFDLLHKRVEHETALQREAEEQDKRERIARVKKAQEERAKAEGQNEEDVAVKNEAPEQNPFKPINTAVQDATKKEEAGKSVVPTKKKSLKMRLKSRSKSPAELSPVENNSAGSPPPHMIMVTPSENSIDNVYNEVSDEGIGSPGTVNSPSKHDDTSTGASSNKPITPSISNDAVKDNVDSEREAARSVDPADTKKKKKKKKKKLFKKHNKTVPAQHSDDSDVVATPLSVKTLPPLQLHERPQPLPPLGLHSNDSISKPVSRYAFGEDSPSVDATALKMKPNSEDADIIT